MKAKQIKIVCEDGFTFISSTDPIRHFKTKALYHITFDGNHVVESLIESKEQLERLISRDEIIAFESKEKGTTEMVLVYTLNNKKIRETFPNLHWLRIHQLNLPEGSEIIRTYRQKRRI